MSRSGTCTMCEEAPATTTWGFPVCASCHVGLSALHADLQQMEAEDPELKRLGEEAEDAFRRWLDAS